MAASVSSKLPDDQYTIDIINGYIKEQQQNLLPSYKQNAYYTIPDSIKQLILLFYGNREYFTLRHKLVSGDVYLKDNSSKIAMVDDKGFGNVFGNIVLNTKDELIHQWKFNILKRPKYTYIYVGIIKVNGFLKITNKNERFTDKGDGYALCSSGDTFSADGRAANLFKGRCIDDMMFGDAKEIMMEFDCKLNTIAWGIKRGNNWPTKSKFSMNVKKDEEYIMAVYLRGRLSIELELESYKIRR